MNNFCHFFYDCQNNVNTLSAWNTNSEDSISNDLMIVVTNIILKLGIPANVRGFFYLRQAIIFKFSNSDAIIPMTKVLYPNVAKTFNTSTADVERSIRHAISIAWNRGDLEPRQEIFSYSVSISKYKPTNSEFIATIVERLKMQQY